MRKRLFILLLLIGSLIALSYLYNGGDLDDVLITTSNNTSNEIETSKFATETDTKMSYFSKSLYETLFDDSVKHEIEIYMSEKEWNRMISAMKKYSRVDDRMRINENFSADFVYRDKNGEVRLNNIGFRTRGNTTRIIPEEPKGQFNRAHFNLEFDETFNMNNSSPEYDILDKRRFATIESLALKWNNNSDPSYVREVFSYNLFSSFGVIVPNASHTTLTIFIGDKEIDFGVYSMIESIDNTFIKRNFDEDEIDGDLYKCLWQDYGPATLEPIVDNKAIGMKDWKTNYRPAYDKKTNKQINEHDLLLTFIEMINSLSDIEFEDYISQNFDIDRFLRYQATAILLGMPDDYWAMGNNYYLYFAPTGMITFIPYDYDHGLGGGWNGSDEFGYEGIATADIFKWKNLNALWWTPSTSHPLIDRIFKIPKYKEQYITYIKELIDDENSLFTYTEFLSAHELVKEVYSDEFTNTMHQGEDVHLDQEEWYFSTKLESIYKQIGE